MQETKAEKSLKAEPLKILFLAHDGTLTGAPMMLLHLARWLSANTSAQFEFVLKADGPLRQQYASLARTSTLDAGPLMRVLLRGLKAKPKEAFERWSRDRQLSAIRRRYAPNVIYANTVAVLAEVEALRSRPSPLLWHIHELPFALGFESLERFRACINTASRFIAASDAVRDCLLDVAVPPAKLDVVHEFVPAPFFSIGEKEQHRREVRRQLNLPDNCFLVGMCGTLDWRKGFDVFPQVAKRCLKSSRDREVHFLWVGGAHRSALRAFEHDIEKLGINHGVTCTGETREALRYMCGMDVLALTSREDPFPLAMLEAGSLGLPVVAFSKAGGASEFVEKDAGIIVDYLAIDAMADAILGLARNPQTCREMGANAQAKVLARYTPEKQGPKVLQVLERVRLGAEGK